MEGRKQKKKKVHHQTREVGRHSFKKRYVLGKVIPYPVLRCVRDLGGIESGMLVSSSRE